jgi:hypothetical protein
MEKGKPLRGRPPQPPVFLDDLADAALTSKGKLLQSMQLQLRDSGNISPWNVIRDAKR